MLKKKSFAIFGANRLGVAIAQALDGKNQSVKVFDTNEEKLNLFVSEFETVDAIITDTTNKLALEKNGIAQFDYVIVCYGSNVQANILTVLNLIDLKVKNIIVNARDHNHMRILRALGIEKNNIVIPDEVAGKLIITKSLFDIESQIQSTDGDYSFTNITVNSADIIGKTIKQVGLTSGKEFNIVQIQRNKKIISPNDKTELKKNDILRIFARNTSIKDLITKLQDNNEKNEE